MKRILIVIGIVILFIFEYINLTSGFRSNNMETLSEIDNKFDTNIEDHLLCKKHERFSFLFSDYYEAFGPIDGHRVYLYLSESDLITSNAEKPANLLHQYNTQLKDIDLMISQYDNTIDKKTYEHYKPTYVVKFQIEDKYYKLVVYRKEAVFDGYSHDTLIQEEEYIELMNMLIELVDYFEDAKVVYQFEVIK